MGQHPHQGRIARAAAGYDPACRRVRQDFDRMRDSSGGDRGQRGSTIFGALAGKLSLLCDPMAESIAVERFGRRLAEEGMCEHALDRGLVDCACRRGAPVVILRLPRAQSQEVVYQRVAWTGIECDQRIAIDERHIGDAAQIEHADGMASLEHSHHGTVEHRHHRRALPSSSDIGGAEVVDHRDAQPGRERGSIAELHGQPAVGPVQHRLAVEAHHRHLLRRHAVCRQEGFDGVRMHIGHQLFRLGEDQGPRGALGQIAAAAIARRRTSRSCSL